MNKKIVFARGLILVFAFAIVLGAIVLGAMVFGRSVPTKHRPLTWSSKDVVSSSLSSTARVSASIPPGFLDESELSRLRSVDRAMYMDRANELWVQYHRAFESIPKEFKRISDLQGYRQWQAYVAQVQIDRREYSVEITRLNRTVSRAASGATPTPVPSSSPSPSPGATPTPTPAPTATPVPATCNGIPDPSVVGPPATKTFSCQCAGTSGAAWMIVRDKEWVPDPCISGAQFLSQDLIYTYQDFPQGDCCVTQESTWNMTAYYKRYFPGDSTCKPPIPASCSGPILAKSFKVSSLNIQVTGTCPNYCISYTNARGFDSLGGITAPTCTSPNWITYNATIQPNPTGTSPPDETDTLLHMGSCSTPTPNPSPSNSPTPTPQP